MSDNMKLQVGYARIDITPKESVPLAGFGNTTMRMSQWVRDPLMASCIAITDAENNTLLLCSLDLIRIPNAVLMPIRKEIEVYYGVPADHMIFSCIHTHAGPDVPHEMDCMQRYQQNLATQLPALVGLALADRRPAELYMGEIETENMNFVKHYKAIPENGASFFFGDNFNCAGLSPSLVQKHSVHATDADPTMHVLRFTRDYCKDLVVANFRCHPLLTSSATRKYITADSVGDFRSAAERRGDMDFVFFQGAAGNINNKSRIIAEMQAQDSVMWGEIMTDYLLKALQNMHPVETAPIKTKQIILNGKVNHATDELLEYAKQVQAVWQATNDGAKARETGTPYGIRSAYHANAIAYRATLPETLPLELNAVSLGELAFISAPNELFDTLSVYVEDNAPFEKVLTLGYANDYMGYIPSKFGYEYTCYESDCTRFAPGIGETVAETFVDMLTELKGGDAQ